MATTPKIYRAIFEYWKLPFDYKATELASEPRGPFEIELYEDGLKRERARWIAVLLPTRQKLAGKWKTSEEAKSTITQQFRRVVVPWHESEFHKPSNQEVLW
jgi:hypothetical protein